MHLAHGRGRMRESVALPPNSRLPCPVLARRVIGFKSEIMRNAGCAEDLERIACRRIALDRDCQDVRSCPDISELEATVFLRYCDAGQSN